MTGANRIIELGPRNGLQNEAAPISVNTEIEEGVMTFDSSISRAGGCPFAKGANDSLATEDLVDPLQATGASVSIDIDALVDTSFCISGHHARPPNSHVALAFRSRCAA